MAFIYILLNWKQIKLLKIEEETKEEEEDKETTTQEDTELT
jgi:hypothetical protein